MTKSVTNIYEISSKTDKRMCNTFKNQLKKSDVKTEQDAWLRFSGVINFCKRKAEEGFQTDAS